MTFLRGEVLSITVIIAQFSANFFGLAQDWCQAGITQGLLRQLFERCGKNLNSRVGLTFGDN